MPFIDNFTDYLNEIKNTKDMKRVYELLDAINLILDQKCIFSRNLRFTYRICYRSEINY